MEDAIAEPEVGLARIPAVGRAGTGCERCRCQDRLEGRSRRIRRLGRSIQQREVVRGIIEEAPVRVGDPADELARVVRRVARQRDDCARPRIQHDRRTGGRAEGLSGRREHAGARALDPLEQGALGHPLHIEVDRELDVIAGSRRIVAQRPEHPARRVDLELLQTRRPAQVLLVRSLQPGAADRVAELIPGERFQLGSVRLADVAEYLGRQRAVRVCAHGKRQRLHAGEVFLPLADREDDALRNVFGQDRRFVRRRSAVGQPLIDLLDGDPEQRREALLQRQRCLRRLRQVVARDPDRERGTVLHEHAPLIVQDAAAGRFNRQDAHPVVLRRVGIRAA